MAPKRLVSLPRRGWNALVDPGRAQRVLLATNIAYRALTTQRAEFDFDAAIAHCELNPTERQDVARRLFDRFLDRFWEDGTVDEKERKGLEWLAKKLEIPETEAELIQRLKGRNRFSAVLAQAFDDGILDDCEAARLDRIARSCGSTLKEFFHTRFHEQGAAFLRALFLNAIEDGHLDAGEWRAIMQTVQRLGVSEADFRAAVSVPARQLLEQILADARSDDEISADEEAIINWITLHLVGDDSYTRYVTEQIDETKRLMEIRQGVLPSIDAPAGIAVDPGEIVHLFCRCRHTSLRRDGDQYVPDVVDGAIVVSDSRLIFASPEKSFQVFHTQVLSSGLSGMTVEIQSPGAGSGSYQLASETRFGGDIWIAAILRARQALSSSHSSSTSRHIPRDVRQRVWHKSGGRCVECGAADHLEFDHIIPHAKGGTHSENNIQILCRRCNLKKSCHI